MRLFWLKTSFTWIASLSEFDHISHGTKIIKYVKPEVRKLCVHLLTIGGDRVAVPNNEAQELFQILTHAGQVTVFKKSKLKIGEVRECHRNSALLWLSNKKKYNIFTGFALSDNTWRRHSWIMTSGDELIETTIIRDKYFGITLKNKIAQSFAEFYTA